MTSPTPYYSHGGQTIYHGDCRDILPSLGPVDLVLTDPPWGIGVNVDTSRFGPAAEGWWNNTDRTGQEAREPVTGDGEPFDPSPLLSVGRRHIVWGGHCFADHLPASPGWLVWDKRKGLEDCGWPLSEGELAWTNVCRGVRFFRHRWMGLVRESEQGKHYHPTQKPVALMAWCVERWSKEGETILDPYMGSGPTLRAAKDLGRRAIGIEIEERYCAIAAERLSQEVLQFEEPVVKSPHESLEARQGTFLVEGEED